MCVQIFYNRMTIPLTMIILEYNNLLKKQNTNSDIKNLLDIINFNEISRREKILETYSWLSIDNLRNIYNNAKTNSDINENEAFHILLGTSDIDNWDLWKGYFGGSHLIGITSLVKGGGPNCSGYQWPPVRVKSEDYDCFKILSSNRKTVFAINSDDKLIFKTELSEKWKNNIGDTTLDWWTQSKQLEKVSNLGEESKKIYNETEKPGIYFEDKYISFTLENCKECELSNESVDTILEALKNKISFYIVMRDSLGQNQMWKNNNEINTNTKQKEYVDQGSGGKALIANPKSFFGLVCKSKNKLAVAGPSGTAWYVLTTALLFKEYENKKNMTKLALNQIEIVAIMPHHSIFEILLAISVDQIKLIEFDINANNKDIINDLLKITEDIK